MVLVGVEVWKLHHPTDYDIKTPAELSPHTNWVIVRRATQNSSLSTSLLRRDHHSNLWALAIKRPSPVTLNVFRSYKVLPLDSITSLNDLRSKKKKKKGGGGWGGGGGGGAGEVNRRKKELGDLRWLNAEVRQGVWQRYWSVRHAAHTWPEPWPLNSEWISIQ